MARKNEKNLKFGSSIKAAIQGRQLQVSGPKGSLSLDFPEEVVVAVLGDSIKVSATGKNLDILGLYGALMTNMIKGVDEGFRKNLEMVGVGFKAKKEGRDLILTIGFSHPVRYKTPEGCEIEVGEDNKIAVLGINKELVGQVAAEIRKLKRPEPYKGKGIKYEGEVIRRKAGKAGKVGASK